MSFWQVKNWARGRELSYVNDSDRLWKRLLIAAIEDLSGRLRVLPAYRHWRRDASASEQQGWQSLLALVGTRLQIDAPAGYHVALRQPVVIIANHPFGIPDGVALMAVAERIGRPYKILVHSDLMRIPEVAAVGLPVDFSRTKSAAATNLRTRAAAYDLLQGGGTVVIFPAGAVATAHRVFGKAQDFAWQPFVGRLIRRSGAHVLPIYIEGQNSALFQLASRWSETLRLALIVSEARRQIAATIRLRIGPPVAAAELEGDDRSALRQLYRLVHQLAPDARAPPTLSSDAMR